MLRLGGDTLTASDVELYRKHYPDSCVLFNSFSCSEAGLLRVYRVDGSIPEGERVVPVGYALDDKDIVLVDEGDWESRAERSRRNRYSQRVSFTGLLSFPVI